ncbi:MAG: DGQHR domain-containing protein [Polyangiaceae bacterium]|nr:DGQHR domain-containing protein [Polyangiaceae bacterium]
MVEESVRAKSATYPSLRARMGSWWYYITAMPLRDVVRWVRRTDQIHSNQRLREWIQRELQAQRTVEIASYLLDQPQHFFGAIVVGIYGGDPEWFPVDVRESKVIGDPQLDELGRGAIGLLRLSGDEKVFAIDGQHRVEGIREALQREPPDDSLGGESLSVLFVGHSTDSEGREKTRRLFSTLNRTAKPVSKGEIVALDEDDAFAIVTRKLLESYPPFMGSRVAFRKQTPISKSDVSSLTTVLGLYDVVLALAIQGGPSPGRKSVRDFMARRPPDAVISELYGEQVQFWDSLCQFVPGVEEVLRSRASDACLAYRHAQGGHLLFRPVGQRVFAQAARDLRIGGLEVAEAVRRLAALPMELSLPPWKSVFWDPNRGNMIVKYRSLGRRILLYGCGGLLSADDAEQTEKDYEKLVGGKLRKVFRSPVVDAS